MRRAACVIIAVAFCGLGCSDPEPTIKYQDILGSERVNIWIQAAGRTYDNASYPARLNSCFENDGSQGKCGRRQVSSEYYDDSVSVGTASDDATDEGKKTECPKPADGAMSITEMVCSRDLVSAKPGEAFYIDVNNEGSAKIVMPIWPNPDKDYLSVSLPVTDQNVFLNSVSDAQPLTLTWDADTEDPTTIEWTISNLDTDPACVALDYSHMHGEGLPDSGTFQIRPSDHTYPKVVSQLPTNGCAALIKMTRVLGGIPIPNIEGTVEARVSSERGIVIFE